MPNNKELVEYRLETNKAIMEEPTKEDLIAHHMAGTLLLKAMEVVCLEPTNK